MPCPDSYQVVHKLSENSISCPKSLYSVCNNHPLCLLSSFMSQSIDLSPRRSSRAVIASLTDFPHCCCLSMLSMTTFLQQNATRSLGSGLHFEPHFSSKSLTAGPPKIPSFHSLYTSLTVHALTSIYTSSPTSTGVKWLGVASGTSIKAVDLELSYNIALVSLRSNSET